jgi:glycosyltransferase involved in cell wall biosynthesis
MTTIAFVTPWYGPDVPGGAEAETRRTAERLHQAGLPIEILTTTIRDLYADWGHNHHKAGVSQINGLTVRRFPVLKREKATFDEVNLRLMKGLPITADQQQLYINGMMRVPKLYDYIAQNSHNYLFIFIPYMFATTYFGAQICPQRSLMIPCLHDESYAYLDIYQAVLPHVRALILHGEAELALYEQIFSPNGAQIRAVLGEGVDTDFTADATRFRQKYDLHDPFMLYVGRREPGKNTPLLVNYWQRYVNQTGRQAKLVLMGPGHINLPDSPAILDLGFVPVQDKYDGLAAAAVFCMPSINESFSLATMESWVAGTPVLVHGDCAATREHCGKANGGLYFTNYEEFVATTDYVFDNPATAVTLGQQGHQYVLDNYRWPTIIGRYQQLINQVLAEL